MKKHTIHNFVFAVIVPTVMFTIALLGVQHIKADDPTIGKYSMDSITVGEAALTADISLQPYLKFDSIQNVCDSALTEYHKRNGRNYYVKLDQLFPDTELKGLCDYTTYKDIKFVDFYCDGGYIGNNRLLVKSRTGEYYLLLDKGKSIRVGNTSFDLRDDLWHNLAYHKELTKATIILLVSLALIIISFFYTIPNRITIGCHTLLPYY